MALAAHDTSSAEIRQKRISIELETLKQLPPTEYKFSDFDTPLGKYIRFQIDKSVLQQTQDNTNNNAEELKEESVSQSGGPDKYIFDVLLDHKYPFQQPQIFCRTPFSRPALNDGRDLFKEIVGSDWRISTKVQDMVRYIPDFIPEVLQESEDSLRVVGEFHLGYLYEMSNWGTNGMNRESRVFNCEEQDEQDEDSFYQRYLVITQSAFLLLEPVNKAKNLGMLQAWATLQSLDKLRRNLTRPDLVTFVWRHIEGKQPWVLNLLINKHEECISLLVGNMQTMGVGVEKNIRHQTKIREFEVTKEALQRMDIEQILEHIAAYESAIDQDLSLSTVQTLNTLYQKAVEYYSAFDDLLYNDFLHKSQHLIARPDIQAVLNSASVAASPRVGGQSKRVEVEFGVGESQSQDYDEDQEEVQKNAAESAPKWQSSENSPPQLTSSVELSSPLDSNPDFPQKANETQALKEPEVDYSKKQAPGAFKLQDEDENDEGGAQEYVDSSSSQSSEEEMPQKDEEKKEVTLVKEETTQVELTEANQITTSFSEENQKTTESAQNDKQEEYKTEENTKAVEDKSPAKELVKELEQKEANKIVEQLEEQQIDESKESEKKVNEDIKEQEVKEQPIGKAKDESNEGEFVENKVKANEQKEETKEEKVSPVKEAETEKLEEFKSAEESNKGDQQVNEDEKTKVVENQAEEKDDPKIEEKDKETQESQSEQEVKEVEPKKEESDDKQQ